MRKTCSSNYLEELTNIAEKIAVDKHNVHFQMDLPPWFDRDKFERGQRFFLDNYVAIMTAHMCGLLTVYAVLPILRMLMFTKRSSTPEAAYKRYYRTVLHIYSWYTEELQSGSKPKSVIFFHQTIFVETLINDGAITPIDADIYTYEIHLPPWFDEEKFKRGQRYFRDNLTAIVTAGFCGLISVLAVPSILDVIIFTERSATLTKAYKRYVLTVLHTLNWYQEELRQGSNSWKSLEYVRRIHAVSGKKANTANSRMLVSQKDVAITQFGFVGYVVLNHQKLGVQHSQEGVEGFVHLWRTIGYMLGLEDRFNLCTDDFETSAQRMALVNAHFLRPSLQNPSAEFVHMTKIMIEGMWCYSILLNYEAFMFMTKRLSNVPGHHYWDDEPRDGAKTVYKEMGWLDRVMLNILMVIHEVLLNFTLARWLLNWVFLFNTNVMNKYLPLLAMMKHGVRKAYVKIVY